MELRCTEEHWKILDAVDAFIAQLTRWRNSGRTYVDAPLSRTLDAMVDAVPDDNHPKGMPDLIFWIGEVKKMLPDADASGFDENHPIVSIFGKLADARNVKSQIPSRRIESMAELMSLDNMRPEQVAKTYGLRDPNGQWRTDLVSREIATPGSVIDIDTGLVRQDIDGWDMPCSLPPSRLVAKASPATSLDDRTQPPRQESDIAPESLESLFALDPPVSDRQIAAMKQIDERDVAEARQAYQRAIEREKENLDRTAKDDRIRRGQEIDHVVNVDESGDAESEGDYATKSDDELKTMCRERGIPFRGTPRRDTLISRLQESDEQCAS